MTQVTRAADARFAASIKELMMFSAGRFIGWTVKHPHRGRFVDSHKAAVSKPSERHPAQLDPEV
jgi:hypothetical protein